MNKAISLLYVSNGLFVLAGAMLVPIYALFAESVGASIVVVGQLAATLLIAKVLTIIAVRSWGDSVREQEYLLVGGFIVRALAWSSLLFLQSIPGLFVVQVLIGIGEGIGSPSFRAIFAKHLKRGYEMKLYANWEIIVAVGGAVGALSGGYLVAQYSFDVLFILMSCIAVLSALLVLISPRSTL